MKKIFINGCFDILHFGHIELFKYAKFLGDHLTVAIDSDKRVKSMKGVNRPINSELNRKTILEAIRYIDKVMIFDTSNELEYIVKEIHPDIMVVGSDWQGKKIVGSEYAKSIQYFNRIPNYSTTSIVDKIFEKKKKYVIDIDGTICSITDGKYVFAEPIKERIEKINLLYNQGHDIILYTARGMNTFKGNTKAVYEKYYNVTVKQLNDWGLKYHSLILGKPSGDVYIDDKGINANDYFK